MKRVLYFLVLTASLLVLFASPLLSDPLPQPVSAISPAFLTHMPAAAGTSKLLIVLGRSGEPSATLQVFERVDGDWQPRGIIPALTGKNGVWPTTTEGALRTPAGVYTFTRAFGLAPDPGSQLPYTQLAPDDLWVDDPASRFYNQWVKADNPAKDWNSAEELFKQTVAYKFAASFDYNMNPTRKGAGSAFFLHCIKSAWTAGCVAVPEKNMIELLRFIDKGTRLVIAASTDELLRLHPKDGDINAPGAENAAPDKAALPEGFVYIDNVLPSAVQDIRYYGVNNFVGKRVDGYAAPRAILSRKAAEALKGAADEFALQGYTVKIFDAYRPQTAVNHFIRWAKDLHDVKTKATFYPQVDKTLLFKEGYIALRSSHSRGSTVDLTIVDSATAKELDMGSPFDFFDPISHHGATQITAAQSANRLFLRNIMEKHGFVALQKEWWHYTLKNEPYPKTYFDFPVR